MSYQCCALEIISSLEIFVADETQHWRSLGPVQYPEIDVPEQAEVCLHVPEPDGVEHLLFVQHYNSLQDKKVHYLNRK